MGIVSQDTLFFRTGFHTGPWGSPVRLGWLAIALSCPLSPALDYRQTPCSCASGLMYGICLDPAVTSGPIPHLFRVSSHGVLADTLPFTLQHNLASRMSFYSSVLMRKWSEGSRPLTALAWDSLLIMELKLVLSLSQFYFIILNSVHM